MRLGDGRNGYIITIMMPNGSVLLVEVWSEGMIPAIAYVQERLSAGEVVCCLKLWA